MSGGDGIFMIDVLRGYHPLSTAFWLSLGLIIALYAYEFMAPSFSDFWDPYIRGLHLAVFTYAAVSIHNSCGNAQFLVRMLARACVLGLVAYGTWASWVMYGKVGFGYPLLVWVVVFMVKEK